MPMASLAKVDAMPIARDRATLHSPTLVIIAGLVTKSLVSRYVEMHDAIIAPNQPTDLVTGRPERTSSRVREWRTRNCTANMPWLHVDTCFPDQAP